MACHNYGFVLHFGNGVKQDIEAAEKYYLRATEHSGAFTTPMSPLLSTVLFLTR